MKRCGLFTLNEVQRFEERILYTLGQAAKEVGCSKATLSRAISKGRLSARRNEDNTYSIEPSELLRWVDSNGYVNSRKKRNETPSATGETPPEMGRLQAELEMTQKLAEDRQRTIDDLRTRLDTEAEERRRLTLMLTDQRAPEEPPRRPRLWLAVGIGILGGAILAATLAGLWGPLPMAISY